MAYTVPQGVVATRISLREKLAYALGDVASNVVWSGVGSFATFYYTNSAGMAAAAIGTMFLISRIFDGISDVIMGLIIDRTRSRFGKARPWLLWMALPFGAAGVLLFSVPSGWGPAAKLFYAFITYNLLSTVIYTAINLSYGTMTALITDDTRDRTLLNVFRMIGAVLCSTTVGLIVMPMVNSFGGTGTGAAWQKTFGILSAAGVVLFFICFLGTKERVGSSAKKEDVVPAKIAVKALFKNKYWFLLTANSIIGTIGMGNMGVNVYYAKYWLANENLVGLLTMSLMLPAFIGLFCTPPLTAKFGKRNMNLAGNLLGIAGLIVMAFFPANFAVVVGANIIRGLGMSAMMGVGFVMIADTIDYGEWKTGVRTEGLTYSASSFGGKVGTGLGAGVLGWALGIGGFDAARETQTGSAMTAMLFVFIYLPIILSTVSSILLWFYKLDRELPGILSDLRERRKMAETARGHTPVQML